MAIQLIRDTILVKFRPPFPLVSFGVIALYLLHPYGVWLNIEVFQMNYV